MVDREPVFDDPSGAPPRQTKKTIDISIGHSHLSKGAKGVLKGQVLREYDFARRVRAALDEYVKANPGLEFEFRFWDHLEHPKWGMRKGQMAGAGYILYDRLVSMYRDKDLKPVVEIAVAIHNNASKNTKYGGLMCIYRMEKDDPEHGTFEDTEGKKLASHLQSEFLRVFPGLVDRKVQADQGSWIERNLAFTKWGFRYRAVPVIVEFGFITCPTDQVIIADEGTPKQYVLALIQALRAYMREKVNG